MSIEVRKIKAKRNRKERLRVAAYARVSTFKEEQEESYETQVTYYTQFIQSNPDWDFVGVYADLGISGTERKNRPELERMIKDCRLGLIDTIYVRSISRLGRNVAEVLEIINELRESGVAVIMEKEGINSLEPQSEIVFNIMASIAQEESRSISENTKWSYVNLARQGIRHIGNNRVYGYDEIDGKLIPNKDAWVAKYALEHYAAGESLSDIVDALADMGAVCMRTHKPVTTSVVKGILINEIYVGDRTLQKRPPIHYLTKKPDYTVDYESVFIKDDHEPVVSREVWEKVQERLKQARDQRAAGIWYKRNNHFMYSRILCGECGELMTRRTISYHGKMQKVWKCKDRMKGSKGNGCLNDVMSEEDLFRIIFDLMGLEWNGSEEVTAETFAKVARVEVFKDRTVTVDVVPDDNENTDS